MPRIAFLVSVILLMSACAGPRPCTQTLCPGRLDGSYEVTGWSGSVSVSPDVPKPPVASDSEVSVLSGEAEFVNGKTTLRAPAGTSFRYSVSTRSISQIEVSSGVVSVYLSTPSAPAATVTAGTAYALPRAR